MEGLSVDQGKVGGFAGGVECLIATGFRLVREEEQVVYVIEVRHLERNPNTRASVRPLPPAHARLVVQTS
jgi:hypothetical protein